jgi:predicted AlkP superfamily phosphohydrolase/phosphomutase
VNPGKHRIFDFYTRDPRNYMPVLSSVELTSYTRVYKLGPIRVPIRKNKVRFLRKSISFWKSLAEKGVFCTVLRVPISFPPEKFYGTNLSAMCTPDLMGTQGSFACFTTDKESAKVDDYAEGRFVPIKLEGGRFSFQIPGPPVRSTGETHLVLKAKGSVDREKRQVLLKVARERMLLKEGAYSPWVKLVFRNGFRRGISGIARFLVMELDEHLRIYMTPINIDPEKPALPVSHPFLYSMSLAKLHGPFSTLGLSEDTWALNERVIDERAFLEQAYDIFEDRKKHFLHALKKNRDGLVVGVFDTSDRIQHMFFRYLDPDHPANKGKDVEVHRDAVEEMYKKMDDLLSDVMGLLRKDDVLMVISDHGFSQFKWGINLNSWLWQEGYLVLKEIGGEATSGLWLRDVDWEKTRAYAYGLTGIFLNLRGREKIGIVGPKEERVALQQEIKEKLERLTDPKDGSRPVRRVWPAQEALSGPYVLDAPDLIVGYARDYRASWNSAVGRVTREVFEDNTRSWSGDHAVDPGLVPGVFFCNRKVTGQTPSLTDIAPTILDLFGLKKRGYHDGKVLAVEV